MAKAYPGPGRSRDGLAIDGGRGYGFPVGPPAKAVLSALALCALLALLAVSVPALGARLPPTVLLLAVLCAGIPLFVAIQRSWTRFLWARRIRTAREVAAKADPGDPEPHVELGVLCSLAGAGAEARAAFERARGIRPGHPQATVGLAHLAAEDGDLERALALFTEAAEGDPGLFAAHYGIGGVQRRREQYARAVLAYERALALEPEDAFTLAELARCHLHLGDAAKAAEYFARATGLGFRDAELERLIRSASAD